jgi:hypothetical protein
VIDNVAAPVPSGGLVEKDGAADPEAGETTPSAGVTDQVMLVQIAMPRYWQRPESAPMVLPSTTEYGVAVVFALTVS